MAGGFTSPAILFLNTWDAPERAFCSTVLQSLAKGGQYTRYVEPSVGAFAMPTVAENAGWTGAEMETSDTSLYASIVGGMLADNDLGDLDVRLDGERVALEGDTIVDQAAYLLYVQLLARTQARPKVEYWLMLVDDLLRNKETHIDSIRERLGLMKERLNGLTYTPMNMWSHIESVMDDPHAVISMNPPTYEGGFEKFFDTKGRLTWAVPEYEVFEPRKGIPRIVDMLEGKAALLLCQQQREPGDSAHPRPVFARHLSLGQNVYMNSNRPDEVFEITGGPRVAVKGGATLSPLNVPVLPMDYEIRPDSEIQVIPVKAQVADYYRGLWMHRLKADPGSLNLLMLVDGHAAGVMGYNSSSLTTPYNGSSRWSRHLILRFAFGAPHDALRVTRLATMVALQRRTLRQVMTPTNALFLEASEGLVTIEYTRHPEAKGLRGLMKLADRTKHPDGYRLIYGADWRDQPYDEVVREFVTKEKQWRGTRA